MEGCISGIVEEELSETIKNMVVCPGPTGDSLAASANCVWEMTVCPGPTAYGFIADARCTWDMIGDVEELLHNLNYGTPGPTDGSNS